MAKLAKNEPECAGSYMQLPAESIDDIGNAICPVCGKWRATNKGGVLRKHNGRAQGTFSFETPREQPDTPITPVIVDKPKTNVEPVLKIEHPPHKELDFVINMDARDTSTMEEAIERVQAHLLAMEPPPKMVTLLRHKYYYDGVFYSESQWAEIVSRQSEHDGGTAEIS